MAVRLRPGGAAASEVGAGFRGRPHLRRAGGAPAAERARGGTPGPGARPDRGRRWGRRAGGGSREAGAGRGEQGSEGGPGPSGTAFLSFRHKVRPFGAAASSPLVCRKPPYLTRDA